MNKPQISATCPKGVKPLVYHILFGLWQQTGHISRYTKTTYTRD